MSIEWKKTVVGNPSTKRAFTSHVSYDKKLNRLIYTCGKCVILRSLDEGAPDWVFNGHKFPVTVAKISPSGFYVASGDEAGNVLIWDCSQPEMILKSEFKVLSSRINDLSWDADSKRIIAVGNGTDKFGHCFTFDSGNSIGEIIGHSNQINSVDIKSTRPYAAFTAGDDSNVVYFKGPPFKFNLSNKEAHSNFVKMVRFSPNGKLAASVGVDRIITLFDGNTGESIKSFKDLSKGGIYAVSWINDDSFLIASADAYLRVIDIQGTVLKEWNLTYKIDNQFLGCCVINEDTFVGLTLDGSIYLFNKESNEPVKVIYGHQVSITAMSKLSDSSLIAGSYDGKIFKHSLESVTQPTTGSEHKGLIVDLVETNDDSILSVSWDDTLKSINKTMEIENRNDLQKQPINMKKNSKHIYVLFENELRIFDFTGNQIDSKTLSFEASSLEVSENFIIISDSRSFKINIYDLGLTLRNDTNVLRGKPSCLSVSSDEKYLACGDIQGKILLYNLSDFQLVTSRWSFHTSKINSIKWSPDNKFVLSGSLDTNLIVYSVEKPARTIKYLNSHKEGVNCVEWLDQNIVVSAGSDACIKYWDIKFQ